MTLIVTPAAVVVASVYEPGRHVATDAVQGVAVGAPISKKAPNTQIASTSMTSPVIAESFLYSPQMAKVFAQFDTDSNGSLSLPELKKFMEVIGLSDQDAKATLSGFDANGDGQIQLAEWERGLEPRMRTAIEKRLNEQGIVT